MIRRIRFFLKKATACFQQQGTLLFKGQLAWGRLQHSPHTTCYTTKIKTGAYEFTYMG